MVIQTALVSVSNKEGVVDFCRELVGLGVRILSTGGTAKLLLQEGIKVEKVSDYTGFPEILGGRVKTLHPKIHGGILALHDDPAHQRVLQEHGISPIGLVVVNLYPFVQTIQREGVTLPEAIEQIDIGGPSMIRAAAKNSRYVTVVVDPADYAKVIAQMKVNGCQTSPEERFRLSRKAFEHTSSYDSAIAAYLRQQESGAKEGPQELPKAMSLHLTKRQDLRYGENPHQRAALYAVGQPAGLVAAKQLQGKELSFNNYIDLQAASGLAAEFADPFCAIIKHTNACGSAVGATLADAYERAYECDPVSAFGSVIGFNRVVDAQTAEKMSSLFVEAIIAPGYEAAALEIFASKKNLRLMEASASQLGSADFDFKKIAGGFLVQDQDLHYLNEKDLKVVTDRAPTPAEITDLLFAWNIAKHVKSNAIIYVKDKRTVGVGAGQMSRVDSARIAVQKARVPLAGAVMASDAFFPFRDGIDEAAKSGIRAVIEPGGSLRDDEVIQAANEHGMAMVFTGIRHFKH
ncbi:MAG: bifunctional phosphoribosylaminoimidazolecarboxamide formyltransferase/IMP cyclohydrolase PurH [Acidobacteria bacterium]|nr:MAG: bifunctional phosphoribosylaminoimidazolecarboxamide formyltransferase/IMP cyclohydrolase PurH [Acidobacteriota bacterium]